MSQAPRVIYLTSSTGSHISVVMSTVSLKGRRCQRCEHEWLPRNQDDEPRVCPKCKSPYWNKPRRIKSGKRAPKRKAG